MVVTTAERDALIERAMKRLADLREREPKDEPIQKPRGVVVERREER